MLAQKGGIWAEMGRSCAKMVLLQKCQVTPMGSSLRLSNCPE